jgi:hypothetical protein
MASRIPLFKAGDDFSFIPNLQPYYKLHGSIDIQDGRNMMLILGGNKEVDIAKHSLLESYHAQFEWWLNMPRARLMENLPRDRGHTRPIPDSTRREISHS